MSPSFSVDAKGELQDWRRENERLEAENARLQGVQACLACDAIHYLHPNAKQGDFSGPKHLRDDDTCGRCGEMWPCDVTELREGYARLKARVEEAEYNLGCALGEMCGAVIDERDRYKALAKRRRKGLEKYGKHGVLCRYGQLPEGESRQDFSIQENERLEALSIKECACGLLAALAVTPKEAKEGKEKSG